MLPLLPASLPTTYPGKSPKGATPAHNVRKTPRISGAPVWVGALLAGLVSMGSAGCAAEARDGEVETKVTAGSTDPKIFGGAKDDDGDAIDGVVALRVGLGNTFELCTGALIAPNLVLTARHCVTKNATTSVSCDENGRSANGEHVTANEDVAAIGVYSGTAPSFAKPALAVGRVIVAPTGPYLCDSDIALVVLATPITDITPMTIRLNDAARPGEFVRAIGYGQNDKSAPIGTRYRKPGVEVLAQGKGVSPSKTPLGPHEFEVGKSICQGDSGGPAVSEDTGAIIGVVSRGGGCDEEFGHIYTTTAGFDAMFEEAFKLAGATPTVETGGSPTGGPSTRSKSAGKTPAASEEAGDAAASCSAGSRGIAGGPTGAGFVVIAAAVAALGLRRRRAV